VKETDAIFEQIKRVRAEAAQAENQLLFSCDAKAIVKIGELPRDGESRVPVRALDHFPPYHSKYNPVERCCGILENHWNGALLDTVEAVVGFAKSMTWKQEHPIVRLVTKSCRAGVRLSKQAMKAVEHKLCRVPQLPSWFIDVNYQAAG